VRIWNTYTGNLITRIRGQDGSIWSLAFSPDRKFLALGSTQDIEVWDVTDLSRPHLHRLAQQFQEKDEGYRLGFARLGSKLAVCRVTLGPTLWDFPSLDHPPRLPNCQSGRTKQLS